MSFVYLHVLWFGLWVLLNTGRFGMHPFDPFPYSLLTMIVSLEAIFLSTFVLISQNRSGVEADARADVALHVGLLTEHEVTRTLQMLDVIQQRLGIADDLHSDLAQLETETKPEDVLAEIQRLRQLEHPAGGAVANQSFIQASFARKSRGSHIRSSRRACLRGGSKVTQGIYVAGAIVV